MPKTHTQHYKISHAVQLGEGTLDPTLVGRTVNLIHEDDFDAIPDGTELISILAVRKVKGKHSIDLDNRGGFLAVGYLLP